MKNFKIRKAVEKDLLSIKHLQESNHYNRLSISERKQEGFVSVESDLSLLRKISQDLGILVAESSGKIVGYEMPLNSDHAAKITLLTPFVERFLNLIYNHKKISQYRWVIEGQICVDKDYRGLGIAEELHKNFVLMLQKYYDLIITEISDQNPRSLHVHTKKLGMIFIDEYLAENKHWFILLQDIRTN